MPRWLTYLDLACATLAAGLWYASSHWEPLLLALAPWVVRLALTRRLTRRTPFDLPLALFLLTAGVGVWVAYDRVAAWARFWQILGGVFLFYALANAAPSGRLRAWLLSAIGTVVAAVFVLTNDWTTSTKIGLLARLGQALQEPFPDLPGPDANANVVGAILAMLLPFAGLAALLAWRDWQSAHRPRWARSLLHPALSAGLALLSACLALLAVAFGWVMSASRAAWAAVLGALLLAVAWLAAGRLGRGSPAQVAGRSTGPLRQERLFAAGLGLALLAFVLVVATRPAVLVTLLNALPGPSAVGSRTDLWRNSLLLARDYPFTGIGLDNFMMAYSSYAMLMHVGFSPHAHNLYLDLAVAQGLPALLILLWLWALFFREFRREPPSADGLQRAAMGAAALSLLAILLHGLVDDTLYANRAVVLFFIPLAFAAAPPAPDAGEQPAHRWPSWLVPAVILLLLGAAVLWRGPLVSPVASNHGAVLQSRAELQEYAWPEWPLQDELRRHIDLAPAIAAFERALVLDPGNPTANRRLGQIELSLGRYEAALAHLQAAYAAEPRSTTTRQLLGEACLANGERELGRSLWAGVSNEQKQLDIRVWWYEHIGDAERAEWMRRAAGGQS